MGRDLEKEHHFLISAGKSANSASQLRDSAGSNNREKYALTLEWSCGFTAWARKEMLQAGCNPPGATALHTDKKKVWQK